MQSIIRVMHESKSLLVNSNSIKIVICKLSATISGHYLNEAYSNILTPQVTLLPLHR